MKIYKFSLYRLDSRISKKVLEVEEKPKTYVTTNTIRKERISKSDIGRVNSYDDVYLLEDDEKKAKELFCEKLKSNIHIEQGRIENASKRIEEYENLIKEILQEG